MIICLLIALLGFVIYAVSSIVTDRLLERRINDIEERLNELMKSIDVPNRCTHTKIESLYSDTSGSDMVNGLSYKENKL